MFRLRARALLLSGEVLIAAAKARGVYGSLCALMGEIEILSTKNITLAASKCASRSRWARWLCLVVSFHIHLGVVAVDFVQSRHGIHCVFHLFLIGLVGQIIEHLRGDGG